MARRKNDGAKGRRGEKNTAVLLVLAAFKTLGQFNVFLIYILQGSLQIQLKN
jgi:hypothetical protein